MDVRDARARRHRGHPAHPRLCSRRRAIVAYAGSDDADDVMAMMEAGADAYCMKGAPLWELERAHRRRQRPARSARARDRAVGQRRRAAELVARELAELTGASFAATYLATADASLSLAAIVRPRRPESLHSAPGSRRARVRGAAPRAGRHARARRAVPARRRLRRGDCSAARRRRPGARRRPRRAAGERRSRGRRGARLGGRRPRRPSRWPASAGSR